MPFWPDNLKDWVDLISKGLATLFGIAGGAWGLHQYVISTRVKAAETLLKVEEEFRVVFPTYEEIEDDSNYQANIKRVLEAELNGTLSPVDLAALTRIDRCLRFFYLCCVLNDTLHVDRVFGSKAGAIERAYYYYIGLLLPEVSDGTRTEFLAYTRRYYPRLTAWVDEHRDQLTEVRRGTAAADR
jgi:hypothetical protein